MTIDNLQFLSLILYIIAVVFLIAAVILFFAFHIPKIISDLSGRTERIAIANIRNQSENPTEKTLRTPTIRNVQKTQKRITNDLGMRVGTEKISTARLQDQETTVLYQTAETTVLTETELSYGETTVLTENFVEFEIIREICYCGSKELIE